MGQRQVRNWVAAVLSAGQDGKGTRRWTSRPSGVSLNSRGLYHIESRRHR